MGSREPHRQPFPRPRGSRNRDPRVIGLWLLAAIETRVA
jgi:hypothetical protein